MKKILIGLITLSSLSAFANDLRNEFSQAKPLKKLNSLKTYELRDKNGELEGIGGQWQCEGDMNRKLDFFPLTTYRWWSPDTSAELIQIYDGKVTGFSSTSSKEMAFRTDGVNILIEFSNAYTSKDAQVSIDNPERFATGYVKCNPIF